MKNIVYQTDEIARIFTNNRIYWDQFYESERAIIDQLRPGQESSILDIGCGCGGLGLALMERFQVEKYTGVDINAIAADAGRQMNPKANILCGDILELAKKELRDKLFDVVFSLSCVDWNVCFPEMLAVAWNHVLPGGHLIATFRLTDEEGCDDIEQSYQYINYEGLKKGELAAYVVVNAKSLFRQLFKFDPSIINARGYLGKPSATAVTPYKELCFVAISIQKRKPGDVTRLKTQLNLPEEIQDIVGL